MIFPSLYLYFSSLVLVFIFLFLINKVENFNYLALPFYPPHFYYLSWSYPTIQIMKVTLNENLNNQLWKYEENFLQLFTFYNYIQSLSRLLCTGLFFRFLSHLPLSFSLFLSLSLSLSLSSLLISLSLPFSPPSLRLSLCCSLFIYPSTHTLFSSLSLFCTSQIRYACSHLDNNSVDNSS